MTKEKFMKEYADLIPLLMGGIVGVAILISTFSVSQDSYDNYILRSTIVDNIQDSCDLDYLSECRDTLSKLPKKILVEDFDNIGYCECMRDPIDYKSTINMQDFLKTVDYY